MSCCSQIWGALAVFFRIHSSSGASGWDGSCAGLCRLQGVAFLCFLLILRLRREVIFPFASCLPAERKMKGADGRLFSSMAITRTALLLLCSALCFSKSCFFKTVTVSQVILSLKIVENKNICQCDIMRTSFLIHVDGSGWKWFNEWADTGKMIDARLPSEDRCPASGLGSGGRLPGFESWHYFLQLCPAEQVPQVFLCLHFSICKMGTTIMPSS